MPARGPLKKILPSIVVNAVIAWKNAELYKGFSERERRRTKTKKVVGRCEIYIYIYIAGETKERESERGAGMIQAFARSL
jgi:hypothetical protein